MKPSLQPMERHLLNLSDMDERVAGQACNLLIRYYGIRPLQRLLDMSGHSNPLVRCRVIWILGHIHAPESYEVILHSLDDPDDRVAYDATIALGILGGDRVIPTLMRQLHNPETSSYIPSAAGEALIRIGKPALPTLLTTIEISEPEMQARIAHILGSIASLESLPMLSRILVYSKGLARTAIIDAISEIQARNTIISKL